MSRVSYQAMLDPSDDEDPRFRELRDAELPSRRGDASERVKLRVSERHARWLDEVTARSGVSADLMAMSALDLMIALDIDWDAVDRPRDLRRALTETVGLRPHRNGER